jgi:hypothetical protein
MKKLLTFVALLGAVTYSFGQGTVNFANSATTLISAGGTSMTTNSSQLFIFGLFVAPSTTQNTVNGPAPGIDDAAWQFISVGAYNTNSPTAVGRLITRNGLDVGTPTFGAGSTVDLIIRGWSANIGTDWATAKTFLDNHSSNPGVTSYYFGTSTIANDLVLGGGAISPTTAFGVGVNQIQTGFNMPLTVVPEPSSFALAGLGMASMLIFRRRK